MKIVNSIIISLLATGLFVLGALLKPGSIRLDVYLGAIWVFVLSLIIVFSLSHVFAKNDDGNRGKHH